MDEAQAKQSARIHEEVRTLLGRLDDISSEIDAPPLEAGGVSRRAQEYVENARISLEQLAELMQDVYRRASDEKASG